MSHIVILGNGIAGITAARHIRKNSKDIITVISGESEHFFSRTALMYLYMGHMKYEHIKPYEDWFWDKNDISLHKAWVDQVDFEQQYVHCDDGRRVGYDKLIIATGSQSNKFGWPGENLKGVQGLYSLQDLETMEAHTSGIQNAVIVGGGLIGIEMAEMLHSRDIHVTYLIREKHFWGNVLPEKEAKLVDRQLLKNGISLKNQTELQSIHEDGSGKVQSITTMAGEEIACEFVGLTVGVHPNIALFKNSKLATDKGILVDDYLQTNIDNVYAIGDCAQLINPLPHRRAIEAVWYAGRMMGEALAQTITGNATKYRPGVWFNSAKFFDLEYQTYGLVPAIVPEDQCSFCWQSATDDKLMNIIYHRETLKVTGVNALGLRQRHEVWDSWLRDGKTLAYVIQHLKKANFDPEFFKRYESEIQQQYNEAFQSAVPIAPVGFFQKLFH